MAYDDDTIERLIASNDSLTRAILGNPKEGNLGLIARVQLLETEHRRFRWLIPFALFGGSSAGAVLTKLIGF